MEHPQDFNIDIGLKKGDTNKKVRIKIRRKGIKNLIRKKSFYIPAGSFLMALVLTGTLLMIYTRDNHTIVKGVTISGINVGTLTQDQAKTVIDKEISKLTNQSLKLIVGQNSVDAKYGDLGLTISGNTALQKAYGISREGSIINKAETKYNAAKGINLDLSPKWDDQKLKDNLSKILAKYNNPATDASFTITSQNTMSISSEHPGSVVDIDKLVSQIKKIDVYKPVSQLNVDFKEQQPNLTAAQLEAQKITGLLASYTTQFDPSETDRTENVRLATKALDMKVIKPGDTLSFNQLVGERTADSGYKDAYIIVDGKFVPGLGGGICQVSSTLYNAGLLANLQIIQRTNHDLAISYVPLGQDATVAYPSLDLKFKNNTDGYLLIRTMMGSNSVTVQLYGKVKPGQEVSIYNTTESIIPSEVQHIVDETLPHGASILKQQGYPGKLVESVRTVKVNGKVVSTEQLPQSRYESVPTIYAVGQ